MNDKNFSDEFKDPLENMIYIDEEQRQNENYNKNNAENGLKMHLSQNVNNSRVTTDVQDDVNCLLDFGDTTTTSSIQTACDNNNSTRNAEDIAFDSIFTNDNGKKV